MAWLDILDCIFDFVFTSVCNTTILVVILLYIVLYWYDQLLCQNLPPKRDIIPLIGSIPGLTDGLSNEYISRLSKRLKSKIITIRMARLPLVYLNDYHLIKECFTTRKDIVDRPDVFLFKLFDSEYEGLPFTSGRICKENRRFTLRLMRDLGMGKTRAEEYVGFEAESCIAAFIEQRSKPFDPHMIINMAVSNIINQFVFGKRFDYANEKFKKCLIAINAYTTQLGEPSSFLFIYPTVRMIFKNRFDVAQKNFDIIASFVREQIAEHREKFDGIVSDLTDAHMEAQTIAENDKDVYNDQQLGYLIQDLFFAGSETTYSTLRWTLLYMAAFPDVQKRAQKELDEQLGDRKLPSMNDKRNTPYTFAVLCEVQRFHTLVPIGVPHTNITEDMMISGYKIPRGTPICANITAVHLDETFWKDAKNFNPENFLDAECNVVNLERLIQFSVGRRSCVGEALAVVELYVFFAAWLKQFDIRLETDDTVPDFQPLTDSGVNRAQPFLIRMIPR